MIAKATRLLLLPESPLGTWGELNEFGAAIVRPDYAISELLYGLRYQELEVDWDELGVTADLVIRNGLGADPAGMPETRVEDIERAIEAAQAWVASELESGGGFA